MTLKDAFARVGQTASATIGTVQVPVAVLDARSAYGRIDLAVSPVGGSGIVWVSANVVTFNGA